MLCARRRPCLHCPAPPWPVHPGRDASFLRRHSCAVGRQPGSRRSRRRRKASAGRARRLVTGRLRVWGLDDLADTAELLVSELVTNALRHARGPVRLNLRATDDRLLCEVEDACDADPVRRTAPLGAEGGRGIELLDLLGEAWGSYRTATGKTTWFELSAVPPRTPS
ncbi:ATP-binding protein [Streptomyces sp. NPDC127106]|uniref:ATP-binding protein n=1 Tax=Streptomyces sp. NPDC127106 TaxID=3345360 RepID=UPI00363FDDDD